MLAGRHLHPCIARRLLLPDLSLRFPFRVMESCLSFSLLVSATRLLVKIQDKAHRVLPPLPVLFLSPSPLSTCRHLFCRRGTACSHFVLLYRKLKNSSGNVISPMYSNLIATPPRKLRRFFCCLLCVSFFLSFSFVLVFDYYLWSIAQKNNTTTIILLSTVLQNAKMGVLSIEVDRNGFWRSDGKGPSLSASSSAAGSPHQRRSRSGSASSASSEHRRGSILKASVVVASGARMCARAIHASSDMLFRNAG